MSQQPDSSPRITRRLETHPVDAVTTPGDGKAGQQDTATGYVIGRLTPAADGMPPRFVLHHATVYPTETDARSVLIQCFLDYGGWDTYTVADITERPSE